MSRSFEAGAKILELQEKRVGQKETLDFLAANEPSEELPQVSARPAAQPSNEGSV